MQAIRAKVMNGRIEPVELVDLPEGTELIVFGRDAVGDLEESSSDSPEAIAAWLRWYDALEPLVFTPEERRAWDQEREARKQWELAHADTRAERLRDLWR